MPLLAPLMTAASAALLPALALLHGLLSGSPGLISSSCHYSDPNGRPSGFGMMVWKGQSIPSFSAQNLPGLS